MSIFFPFSNKRFDCLTVNFPSGEVLSTKSAAGELTTKSVREGKLGSVSASGVIVCDLSILDKISTLSSFMLFTTSLASVSEKSPSSFF